MKTRKMVGLLAAFFMMAAVVWMAASGRTAKAETEEGAVREVSEHNALQAALDAGGTVRMKADISGGVNVGTEAVLDLNGFILNGEVRIVQNGNLTLKDSDPDSAHDSLTYSDPTDPAAVCAVTGGVITGGWVKID